jgi:hypothetical protein
MLSSNRTDAPASNEKRSKPTSSKVPTAEKMVNVGADVGGSVGIIEGAVVFRVSTAAPTVRVMLWPVSFASSV